MATPRIFVSHSHQDNAWCSQLVDALTLAEFDVWFDKQGLYVGDQWVDKLETELESRDVFLVVLTPESWSSPWVRREVQLAIHRNKRILGVKHTPVEISGFITTYQILDAAGLGAHHVAQQIAGVLGGTVQPKGITTVSPRVAPRTDGLYLAFLPRTSTAPYYHALRVFDDTVEYVSSPNTASPSDSPEQMVNSAAQLAKWHTWRPGRTSFEVADGHIAFTMMASRKPSMDCLGTISADRNLMELEAYLRRSGTTIHRTYTFVPLRFAD